METELDFTDPYDLLAYLVVSCAAKNKEEEKEAA